MSDFASRLDALESQVIKLSDQIEIKDTRIESLEDRVTELEGENQELREENEELREENEEFREELDEMDAKVDHTRQRQDEWIKPLLFSLRDQIQELQGRELKKGGRLRTEHVIPDEIPNGPKKLETTVEDGIEYYKPAGVPDTLEDGGPANLPQEDLLPIQQLARADDEMLEEITTKNSSKLAAKLWAARGTKRSPWQRGSRNVREYISASDLRTWILRQRSDVTRSHAKKLVSRVIDGMLRLTNYRLEVKKQSRRTDGLSYQERKLIIPDDMEIPGEPSGLDDSSGPGTTVVTG